MHTGNYSYINIDSESITLGLTRGNINIFFPIFIAIIVAESLIFIPYYLEKKKADAPGIPLGCVAGRSSSRLGLTVACVCICLYIKNLVAV